MCFWCFGVGDSCACASLMALASLGLYVQLCMFMAPPAKEKEGLPRTWGLAGQAGIKAVGA